MANTNDDRYVKKDGKTLNKSYVAKKHSKEAGKKLFSKLFVAFLILLTLGIIIFNLYSHPYMQISEIYVSGNNKVTDTEIIGQLRNPIGQNIVTYNPEAYEDDIKQIKYVDNVKIKKVFPNLINVKITENYPLFYQWDDGESYIISNNGKYLADEDMTTDDLIEITGASLRKAPGENFTASEASMKFILAIQEFSYFKELKQLNLENKADIGIIIDDIDVKFGDLNNINYKLNILDKILNDIKVKGVTAKQIDLDNGKDPVVKVEVASFSENLNN